MQSTQAMQPMTQQMMSPTSFTEKAMARREARLEKSTAAEIKKLEVMKQTGVMSPVEADALKVLALAALQIDKQGGLPKMPPPSYTPIQPAYIKQ